jgi:hypothetical protein
LSGAKGRTLKRNLEYSIDIDYIKDLYKKQNGLCFYSGIPMEIGVHDKRDKENNGLSLDRINSDIGYKKGNIVLCCAFINAMKLNLSQESFIKTCKKISEIH